MRNYLVTDSLCVLIFILAMVVIGYLIMIEHPKSVARINVIIAADNANINYNTTCKFYGVK